MKPLIRKSLLVAFLANSAFGQLPNAPAPKPAHGSGSFWNTQAGVETVITVGGIVTTLAVVGIPRAGSAIHNHFNKPVAHGAVATVKAPAKGLKHLFWHR